MRTFPLVILCLLGAPALAAPPPPPCPATFTDAVAAAGNGPITAEAPLVCGCTPAATRSGEVWGSEVYRDASSICRAAIHAGVTGGGGGIVTVYPVQAAGSYDSTSRFGVTSKAWQEGAGSFQFTAPDRAKLAATLCPQTAVALHGEKPITCHCGDNDFARQVWGTDVYTADSALCAAALHAGAITWTGGDVTLHLLPGQSSYEGSKRHRVATASHGPAPASMRFDPPLRKPDCWSSDCGASVN
jgi:LCCL domain-containing protein